MAQPEVLLEDYKETRSDLRNLGLLRLGLLSFFAIFVAAMVRFMSDVYQKEPEIIPGFRILLPLAGFLGTVMFYYVEARLIQFYDIAASHGFDLEELLEIPDGVYHRIKILRPQTFFLFEFTLRQVATTVYAIVLLFFATITLLQALGY